MGRKADIEVLESWKDHTVQGSEWEDIWIPAESVKLAKNGSVYADTGNYYDPGYNRFDWYKKGKWRYIK